MKDITALLISYSNQAALHKAVNSLEAISPRLESTIVLRKPNVAFHKGLNQIKVLESNDLGQTLNRIIPTISSSYVLFLQETDYLSPTINMDALQLHHPKTILGSFYYNRDLKIQRPLLVSKEFLNKHRFLSSHQLPFEEALFPSWLSTIEPSLTSFKENLVRQSRKNSSSHIMEKQKIIQKYQLNKVEVDHPSLSVLITNYNMGEYVETAVVSCLLQSEQVEQLLIIDDGSTDSSYTQLQQWEEGTRIRVFHKKNEGKAKALNDLLPYVTSDFILELDADDWLDPDAVSAIKKRLVGLPKDVSVLYGNFRKWKQSEGDVLYKRVMKGHAIKGRADLLSYRFPLGPRIYRTSILQQQGGFPVIEFEKGRLYEDVSVLNRLIKTSRFSYQDFTVYNIREHTESITKSHSSKWNDFLKTLD
ncbi:glycosyltransferase family 2 protein [Halobacillus naozhouensis]|uniref:Glycosyltransferase family 2 protein n=1 Tax=Halobacillus naozhouensis TaxID=554880 RepID=A0ABY8IUU8_9BACI|nr:glycosyltransferase family 2 protein [Halobacillus naozhouensis]WFT73918.1 glycosyltransferase family 2 protein [Halobacillus naozhouensis]